MDKRILIIEDEEDIVELISYNLKIEGFFVDSISSGIDVLKKVEAVKPDLIILDLMLPGISGLEICRQIKQTEDTRFIPIIMLTAKSEESDIVLGLELGASDYVTKPFSPKVLNARVRSVLRQNKKPVSTKSNVLEIEGLRIILDRREVFIVDEYIDLTYSEFQVLYLLASHIGRVFSRYQIIEEVHGNDYIVTDRAVDVLIVNLRKKLLSYSKRIETVRGVGYRFNDKKK
ncbi:MAG: response regulator transcription factor [bacterium]|nr:response regulator transcription factor [bacterium]